jgi:glycosyltransferase involved in cell wall biosynthesis
MKVSIITTTYNSAATVRDTLESVKSQDHADIEHIIVDGRSTDSTIALVKSYPHVAKYVSEEDQGLYDAINKGIRMSTGDIVGILNSDDFFPDSTVISSIVKVFEKEKVDAVYGDIAFVKPDNLRKIVRYYSSRKFHPRKFAKGYMPAHPSFYAKRSCFEQLGLYQLDYKIAADFELLMRFFMNKNIKTSYLHKVIVYMRTGGVSNKNVLSRYTLNKEIIKACKENGVKTNMLVISLKYLNKVFEYIRPALSKN